VHGRKQANSYSVQVTNFRNIDDSGWIPIERVTAFVGRNESGKTALLKALHKFNPATPEPYKPQREFPRDRFTREFENGADCPFARWSLLFHRRFNLN
jgi:AAA15 family ATPase/GTPase